MPQLTLRYLWVFSAPDQWTVDWHCRQLARRRQRGFDVEGFCTTIPYLDGRWLRFPELDQRWRTGEPTLMRMCEDLAALTEGRDVLVLYNGANLHPDFVRQLKLMKVYTSGDPESNDVLARPLAPEFDIHLVNQEPSVDVFKGWGLEHVHFWPLGSLVTEEDVDDIEAGIMDTGRRPLPIVFVNGRSRYRQDRVETLVKAFPEAFVAGQGWPRGFLNYAEMYASYRKGQIGWNVHNTTGFGFRTFELPAHGVMQICDNKQSVGSLFVVGREIEGFDTIEECIDLTRYYMAHPSEQREMAWAGYKRWLADYTPDRIWDRLVDIVQRHVAEFEGNTPSGPEQVAGIKRHLHARRWRARCREFPGRAGARIGALSKRCCTAHWPLRRRQPFAP